MSESEHLPEGKSDTQLAIETFVDRMKEMHPDLDREELYDAISGYVQEYASDENGGEEEQEQGLMDKAKDKLPGQ